MDLRDLIVTPVVLVLLYVAAYFLRPYLADEITRRYFLPGLTVRIVGAIALGFIYQFYYGGGDTFNFHTHGSRIIWEAFVDSPEKGIKLLLSDGQDVRGVYNYAVRIPFFKDSSSFAVVRIATVVDFFTYSTYTATAAIFAAFSFVGMWLLFKTFYQLYPHLHRQLAIICLFVPSVFFWGSGVLKDTITLGCVGIATYQVYRIFILRRFFLQHAIVLLLALYALYVIKVYILLTFLPAIIFWIFLYHFQKIRSAVLKFFLFPVVMLSAVSLGYLAMLEAGAENPRYALGSIAKTAQETAYDIRYYTGKEAGSGYALGELDGTWQSMARLAPQAINVALFRPYLWEVRNPLMALSAVESLIMLGLTIFVIVRLRTRIFSALMNPTAFFSLMFSLVFAFAVGVSTYNFGTLTRYKIPLLPFYLIALALIWDHANRERKLRSLENTE